MSGIDENTTDQVIPYSPHSLSEETKAELISLLGIDSDDPGFHEMARQLIDKVERSLGIYAPASDALKDLPSAGDFVSAMKGLKRCASRLQESLSDTHARIRGALNAYGLDLETLERELSKLQASANLVEASSKPTRGRPKKDILIEIVHQLRMIFRRYYKGPMSHRKTQGAIEHLSEPEQDEADFIKFALEDAKIPHDENVRRYFAQIGNSAIGRDSFLEGLAAKTIRRRKKNLPTGDGDNK